MTQPDASVVDPTRARCIICGGADREVTFHEFGVDILECVDCGHVYSSWPGGQDYDGYFGTEPVDPDAQQYWDAQHARMYDDFVSRFLVGRRGRLLDVGCGLGFFVKRVAEVPGWDAHGYEISPQAVAFARERLGLANVFCGKVESSGFPSGSFDVITLWDVIEHIPDPDPLLSYLGSLLRDDGMLCLHTPNATIQLPKAKLKRRLRGMSPGLHYLEARDHINIYRMSTLRRVLTRCGFRRVRFVHLSPIEGVAGDRRVAQRLLKRAWFLAAVAIFHGTLGRLNLDNLFVVARR